MKNMAKNTDNVELPDNDENSVNNAATDSGEASSSSGPSRPGMKRMSSYYTPYLEDRLRRKLKFFFMGPDEKFKARRKVPWKLLLQILKIFIVTAQV